MALDRRRDLGLLVLRVGVGLSFVGYGAPKLLGLDERARAASRKSRDRR